MVNRSIPSPRENSIVSPALNVPISPKSFVVHNLVLVHLAYGYLLLQSRTLVQWFFGFGISDLKVQVIFKGAGVPAESNELVMGDFKLFW